MLITTSHTERSSNRTQEKPHVLLTPVVREIPRPTAEPLSWSTCW